MRCIEILIVLGYKNHIKTININMRCIEIFTDWHNTLTLKININMRCIEIGKQRIQ